jgi:hypothetical protein
MPVGRKGISSYIKERLEAIESEKALPLYVLVGDLVERFPTIKTKTGASARVNLVLKQQAISAKFKKIRGKDNKTYIVKN